MRSDCCSQCNSIATEQQLERTLATDSGRTCTAAGGGSLQHMQWMHGWRGPLVDVLIVLCGAVCCGAGGVGVSRVCVWLCVCRD